MGETPYSPLGILRQALASPNVRRPRCFTKIQNLKLAELGAKPETSIASG
ncbi:hypothetical protein [Nostoc sp.]